LYNSKLSFYICVMSIRLDTPTTHWPVYGHMMMMDEHRIRTQGHL
jgi:hypothetical protein